jgi:hypothetical protein
VEAAFPVVADSPVAEALLRVADSPVAVEADGADSLAAAAADSLAAAADSLAAVALPPAVAAFPEAEASLEGADPPVAVKATAVEAKVEVAAVLAARAGVQPRAT